MLKISRMLAECGGGAGHERPAVVGACTAIGAFAGVASAANTIYWSNDEDTTVVAGNLDGSGTPSTFASVSGEYATGLAFDAAGNLYIVNASDSTIDKATPGGDVSPVITNSGGASWLAIAEAPAGTGAPAISGANTAGQPLSCGTAMWAPDPPGGLLFKQPTSTAVGWQLNGAAVPGASGSSFTPTQAGTYTCSSTATNQAGAITQTSAAVRVNAAATSSSTPTSSSTSITAALAPTVTRLSQSHAVWAEGRALARFAKSTKKKPPVGTTFSFALNESANVSFTFTQKTTGRKIEGECVSQTRRG